ncbi:MAG: hypothetical protein WA823_16315 [Candidatus Acidiferrales bacterium]
MSAELPAPWPAFLGELDTLVSMPVERHCIGGFAMVADTACRAQ